MDCGLLNRVANDATLDSLSSSWKEGSYCSSLNRCIFSYFEYSKHRRFWQSRHGEYTACSIFLNSLGITSLEAKSLKFACSRLNSFLQTLELRNLDDFNSLLFIFKSMHFLVLRIFWAPKFLTKPSWGIYDVFNVSEQFRHHFSRSKIIKICMFKVEFVRVQRGHCFCYFMIKYRPLFLLLHEVQILKESHDLQ